MAKKTFPLEDALQEWMQDPEFRAEYEALKPNDQVTRLRIERGLTQAELAECVGTKQPSIARLESGRRDPSLDLLRRVATALGARLEIHLVPLEESSKGYEQQNLR
jgi:transcriptional regulator with XRE-family HTH domain